MNPYKHVRLKSLLYMKGVCLNSLQARKFSILILKKMAKASKGAVLLVNMALLLSLLFVFGAGFETPTPRCIEAYGVRHGDTCSDVGRRFGLTPGKFIDLNPNLVCEKMFIGQWLCVGGSV